MHDYLIWTNTTVDAFVHSHDELAEIHSSFHLITAQLVGSDNC